MSIHFGSSIYIQINEKAGEPMISVYEKLTCETFETFQERI